MDKVDIKTRDGVCPAYVFKPAQGQRWPAVLVYMDGLAIRPAMLALGERLAAGGYYVLLPDLYYRGGPYAPMDPNQVFADAASREKLMAMIGTHATAENMMSDTRAFLDFLAKQPDVAPGPIGTTGYCMGGRLSLLAAATFPDRVAAAASFHGGHLASDAPDSPHRRAADIKARVYVAGAIEDASFPDDMKARLDQALAAAGADYTIETYPARHGWVFPDFPVYDAASSDRHYAALQSLYDATLKRRAA